MTTKMPTDARPLAMEPELQEFVEGLLAPLSGKRLEAGQEAVRKVHSGGLVGMMDDLRDAYREAVAEAVSAA